MSRLAQRGGTAAATISTTALPMPSDDAICPVCKASRYWNSQVPMLMNPECYHKICKECVDRYFSHGPAPCPVAGCGKTLRRNRFRKQTFEDLQVEREIDIRKWLAGIFNRREDEFDSLKDYNDYLNQVEDWTYNLIQNIDVEATKKQINAYKEANQKDIAENVSLANQEHLTYEQRQAAEKQQARLRREAARREAEEERRIKEEGRNSILNKVASGEANLRDTNRVELKRASGRGPAKPQLTDPFLEDASKGAASPGFQIKGLKKRVQVAPEAPFDPFEGLLYKPQYHVVRDNYPWDFLDSTRKDIKHAAGGYDVAQYCARALCDAFSGLGVFIEDEIAAREGPPAPEVVEQAAAEAATSGISVDPKIKDDVF
ncbi:CDK-activating kinase assembly factor MAT1 [Coniosporium apollinis CBS 100218]|uniref:RNA polymerase II transcription factor B subunit 3 n=1 Tax=Coniosporium apollinis (strain CBS 100218) TaxID=1168221 RepID=R7Z1T6_CONA1|nr:CDK-activating kinase assembly factor MAT1 [Coniosporium apollinis CBS 100218]EON68097.1 CDK-activating kinase assembly factor MAT1 [Coniosporium apollinis CBS 100218]